MVRLPLVDVPTPQMIEVLEIRHHVLDLYLWLSQRFPESFTDMCVIGVGANGGGVVDSLLSASV